MNNSIFVDFDQVRATAGKIEDTASGYKASYEKLYSEVETMLSSWQGEDMTAYINRIKSFRDDFEKMYSLMMNYVTFLRSAAKTYEDNQDEIVKAANKLKV